MDRPTGEAPVWARDWVDPVSGETLIWQRGPEPGSGWLVSPAGTRYPVEDQIPRFSRDDFAESFGFQWNRFDVIRAEEDRAIFAEKVGVPPESLAGHSVLDAGCGGGRYSRVAAAFARQVVAVDRSRAVEQAARNLAEFPNVRLAQADLTELPLSPGSFDLVFSIGVLHHSPDPRGAFRAIAKLVRPGGRLSIWVYRRNRWPQERLNDLARWVARRMPRAWLLRLCHVGAFLGGVPGCNRTLNKVLNFSNHPVWEIRVCDTFDWYAPVFQSHHTSEEIRGWYEEEGFVDWRELRPPRGSKIYLWALDGGWIVGSGVNFTGIRASEGTGS